MELEKIKLKQYGPFYNYTIDFHDLKSCILLTGRNNEGKSSIIFGLRLVDAALRVINKRKNKILIERQTFYRLLLSDTENINFGRLIHNYERNKATIVAEFQDGFSVTVYIDVEENLIYSDFEGIIPDYVNNIFGFMPVLGPLSENEEVLSNTTYIKANFRTSLAPRHLRNTLKQVLTKEELELVRNIIKTSWKGIELGEIEFVFEESKINVFFKENDNFREIAWAGQGLQVWFQIVTHLVRLRNYKILILDEPEINLHPEKQNDLIRIISENFDGSTLIATHSVELMNNVSVDHIINVRKASRSPRIKSTDDRKFLETIRSQIGSNFNLIASQFEQCEKIIFTEDKFDYDIIEKIASKFSINKKTFNIPLHGFCEYPKAITYKRAYEILIGNNVNYTVVLDRDYYPQNHLDKAKNDLVSNGIDVVFTPGKEIENLLIQKEILRKTFSEYSKFESDFTKIIDSYFDDSFASLITLYETYLIPKIDTKTIVVKYSPYLRKKWEDHNLRYNHIPGKKILKELRKLYRKEYGENLSSDYLIRQIDNQETKDWIKEVYK